MRTLRLALIGAALFVAATWAPAAGATTYNVTRTDDPTPDGCVSGVDCSLREAVIASEATVGVPDLILLPAGTFQLTRVASTVSTSPDFEGTSAAQNPAVGDLDLKDIVTISGAGSGMTFIDAGGIDRVFDIISTGCTSPAPCVWIDSLTVENGRAKFGWVGHGHGGAIHNHGRILLTNVGISGSAPLAGWGGGGLTNAPGGDALLENVTVAQNSSTLHGGGIEDGGTIQLFNDTLSGNTAPAGEGGGIWVGGTASLQNTIVAGNTGGDCKVTGTMTSLGHNLSGDMSCTAFTATGDLTNTNPQLVPVSNAAGFVWIYALAPTSPAIDKGTNTLCPSRDQRGVARPQDGDGNGTAVCDIGAYEFVRNADLSLTKTDSLDPVAQGGTLTYTITVQNAGPGPAPGTTVTDTLPAGVTFVSASAGCTEAAGTVTCNLGTLASGGSSTVTIVVTAQQLGVLSNTASVSSSAPDSNPANNSAIETTTVQLGCFGQIATITGAGFVLGTPGPDVIIASNGFDVVLGLAGDDAICTRGGSDLVSGGRGADRIDAGNGDDLVLAGPGNDIVFGGFGSDLLFGGSGNDSLDGDSPQGVDPQPNEDICVGGPGVDTATNCEDVSSVP